MLKKISPLILFLSAALFAGTIVSAQSIHYTDAQQSTSGIDVSGTVPITVGAAAGDVATESGDITGIGLFRFDGPGTLNLRGDNRAFSGSVSMSTGTLNFADVENFFAWPVGITLAGTGISDPSGFPTLQIEAGQLLILDGSTGTSVDSRFILDGAGRLQILDGATLTFTGNTTKNGSNPVEAKSFQVDSFSRFVVDTVGTDSLLDMLDPMGGDGIEAVKTGTGTWKLGGTNRFIGNDSSFTVGEGTLYLYGENETYNDNFENAWARVGAGAIELSGSNTSFTLDAGTTLGAGIGAKIAAATINIDSSATLAFNLADVPGGSTDPLLELVGTVNFIGIDWIKVDLLSLPDSILGGDTYSLVKKSSGYEFLATVSNRVTLLGKTMNGSRLDFTLISGLHDLSLRFDSTFNNQDVFWNGGDGTWDLVTENWNDGTNPIKFFDGDTVYFGGTGGVIDIAGKAVTVGDIMVSGAADYTFNGSIIADLTYGNGTLTKSGGGTLTLNGANDFQGGAEMSGGTIVLGHEKALGDGTLGVQGDSTLKIEKSLRIESNIVIEYATAELTFDIASGHTLILDGLNGGENALIDISSDSGDLAGIRFTGGGNLAVVDSMNSTHGGGIYLQNDDLAADRIIDFSLLGSFRLTGNRADSTFDGGALYAGSDNGLFPANHLEIRFGNNTVVSGNTAGGHGGGLYIAQDLSLSGNTLFQGNTAGGSGGAIHMAGNTGRPAVDLLLDATGGDIAFNGNGDGAGANAIHLAQKTFVTISGGGNVYFDDPISAGSSGGNGMLKTGTGIVQFAGANVLNPTSGGAVTVDGGVFRLASSVDAPSSLTGIGNFLVSKTSDTAFGTLAGSGTVEAVQSVIEGVLAPDADRFETPDGIGTASATAGRTTVAGERKIGVLNFSGDVHLDGATLEIDLGADGTSSDFISVTGVFSAGGSNTIDLNNWVDGSYDLFTATAGLTAAAFGDVRLNGSTPGTRQQAILTVTGGDTLHLATKSYGNVDLDWNATDGDWNEVPTNKAWLFGVKSDAFVAGDSVRFGGTGDTVTIDAAGTTVSGMTVGGGSYVFTGGAITGTAPTATDQTVTGKLEITGGSAVFRNEIGFTNGMEIAAGAAATLAGGFDSSLSISNSGTLIFDRTGAFSLQSTLSGAGSFVKRNTGALTMTGIHAATGLFTQETGTVILDGTWGGDYTQEAAGTFRIGQNNATVLGDVTLAGIVDLSDRLTVGGNLILDDNTFLFDPTSPGGIDVVGIVSYADPSGSTEIDLLGWSEGEYVILSAAGGIDIDYFHFAPPLVGGSVNPRQRTDLTTLGDTQLIVKMSVTDSLDLTWAAADGTWDYNTANTPWKADDDMAMAFLQHDYAIFDGSGGTITVRNAGIETAGMVVRGGNFVFRGGKVTGSTPIANGQTVTGKLEILGGSVRLENETDFIQGIEIGSATLEVAADRALGEYVDSATESRGQLTVAGPADVVIDGDRTVRNRFVVASGGDLRLDASPGSLAVVDVQTSKNGAAVSVTNGTADFSGGIVFLNNSTTGSGGAVHAENAELHFDSSDGWIVFDGNRDASGANAVMLAGSDNLLHVYGSAHGVFFDDPIRAAGTDNRLVVNFSSPGAFVQFRGANSLAGTPALTGGTMRVTTAASFNAGAASVFTVASGAALAGGGTVTAATFNVTGGTLNPDRAVLTRDNPYVSFADRVGTLSLLGDVVLDGATLEVDLLPGDESDRIEVSGGVTFGTNLNTVLIRTWSLGEFTIMRAASIADITGRFALEFAGRTLDDTKARLYLENAGTLILKTTGTNSNEIVEWVNGTGNGTWDTTGMDWGTGGEGTTIFMPGDYVVFAGDGQGAVRLIGDTALVSGMEVRDGNYEFKPETRNAAGTIKGELIENMDGYSSSGALTQSGGTTKYYVQTDFALGYRFRKRSKAIIANNHTFGIYGQKPVRTFALDEPDENVPGQLTFYEGSDTVIGAESSHRICNRFVIKPAAALTFEIKRDEQLIVENVHAGAVSGAVLKVSQAEVVFDGLMEFRNTSTDGLGGAFYMAESEFYFETDKGGTAFYSNADSLGDNSGTLDGDGNLLHFTGSGYGVVFGSGIRSTEGSSGNRIVLDYAGADAFTEFRGVNTFDTTGATDNGASVSGGSFRITSGSSFDFGSDGFIFVQENGSLAGGGVFAAPDVTFSGGAIRPDGRAFTLSSQIVHDEFQTARLTLQGDTTFSGTTLDVELKRQNASDTVAVDGTLLFGAETNRVNVNAWNRGTFTVLETTDPLPADAAIDLFELRFGGETVGTRQTARLEHDGNRLLVHTDMNDADRLRLLWTGSEGNMLLNAASTGNWVTEFGVAEQFNHSDFLVFDETGTQGTVTLGNADGTTGGRTVSGILINGGSYTFTGGDLFGIVTKSNPSDGNLLISDGNVTFENNVFFEGNVEILNRSTVTLPERKAFHALGDFVLAETAMLTVRPGDDLIRGRSVTLDGAVFLIDEPVPTSTRPYEFTDMISATETPLDVTNTATLFDLTVGLLERHADFADDGKSMTLRYTATPLRQYAAGHGFTPNETAFAAYFQDTFNNWEMGEFELFLMNMDDTELATLFDGLSNAVLIGESARLALSNPYRAVAPHLADTEEDFVQKRRRHEKPFSTRNFRFSTLQRDLRQDGDGTTRRYDISRTGMNLTLDGRIAGNFRVGLLFSYAEPKLYQKGSRIEADDYTVGIYAQQRLDDWDLNGFFAYGDQSYKSRRRTFDGAAAARYDGEARFATLEAVRRMKLSDRFTFLPTAALDYQGTDMDGLTETGSMLRQSYDKSGLHDLVLRFGLNSRWRIGDRTRLDIRLQYGRQLDGDRRTTIRTSMPTLSSAAPMRLRGVDAGRDRLNVGLGGQHTFGAMKPWRIFGHYDFDRGNRSQAHTGELGFLYAW